MSEERLLQPMQGRVTIPSRITTRITARITARITVRITGRPTGRSPLSEDGACGVATGRAAASTFHFAGRSWEEAASVDGAARGAVGEGW